MPSLQATADAFLGRYERTIAKKSNGRGNFQFNKRGDLVSIHQLTNHAKERAKERGISLKDAAGKHAIVAENGAIVTTYRKNIGRRDIAQELRRRTLSNHEVRHELELSSGGTARLIIGKRGESIQRLEKAHGIRAAVTKRNETKNNPRFLILVGPKEGVAEASRKVQDVIDKNSSTKSTLPEGHAVIERAVPRQKIGQVMGKKG